MLKRRMVGGFPAAKSSARMEHARRKCESPLSEFTDIAGEFLQRLNLVAVVIALVRARSLHTNIVGLLIGQLGQFGIEFRQLQPRHFLVQLLR
jgi:hypothetical protein